MKNFLFLLFLFSGLGSLYAQTIHGYEYWFDEDFTNRQIFSVSPLETVNLNFTVSASALSPGMHILSFRFLDENGTFSPVNSTHFYKPYETEQTIEKKMQTYEYWFDMDYANRASIPIGNQKQVNLSLEIGTSAITDGIHILNHRFKDDKGQYSPVVSLFAYKVPQAPSSIENKIIAYRYWIDDDFANSKDSTLSVPAENLIILDKTNLGHLSKGYYTLNFQFKDQLGQWNSVSSTEIEKDLLPVSNFTYTTNENCDSTKIIFSNLSIDADTYFWEFGDGESTTSVEPEHTYYTPGVYQVRLLATNATSGSDSLKTVSVTVKGNTSVNLSKVSCGPYTSPSGLYTWSNSGVYYDTLVNSYGCDSLLTIQLTVNPVIVPNPPIATGNYRCGPGSLNLSASGCTSTYNWFSSNTDPNPLGVNSQFATPEIGQTTTYYVACNEGACLSARTPVVATVHVNVVHPLGILPSGTYSSSQTINSKATLSSPTTYKSGGSILLEPGFKANTGTVFKAEISPCEN
mgnify:CR=1 FL=1